MKLRLLFCAFLCLSILAGGQTTVVTSGTTTVATSGTTTVATTVATAPTPSILWWKVNDSTAQTGSASGGGDAGTTDAARLARNSGFALDFNGTTHDAATTAALTFGNSVITFCGRVFLDAVTGTQIIAESSVDFGVNNHSWVIYMNGAALSAAIRGTSSTREEARTGNLSTATWYHILVVLDNSTETGDITFYVDGVLSASTIISNAKTGTANFSTYITYLGARASASLFIDGQLDSLEIHSGDVSANVNAIINRPAADQ